MRYFIGFGSLLFAFICALLALASFQQSGGDGGISAEILDGMMYGLASCFFVFVAFLTWLLSGVLSDETPRGKDEVGRG